MLIACVCDPWDGELRVISVTSRQMARGGGADMPISITLGGDRREYGAGNNRGTFGGRIIRPKKWRLQPPYPHFCAGSVSTA